MSAPLPETPAPSFEANLSALSTIVRELEDGELGIEASLARYEEGVRLLKVCQTILQQAQRKVELLTGLDEAGQPTVEPFAAGETSSTQRTPGRARRTPKGTKPAPEETGPETSSLFE